MSKRYQLRRGDICPCCGQTIETDDAEMLDLITRVALYMEQIGSGTRHLSAVGFEWPEEDDDG